jgi:hypothetical protein
MEESVGREGLAVEFVSRVQLRAVFSGLAVAVGCFAICMGFSWALGLSTFQPSAAGVRGLTLGNIIWGAIALWISIFFGAFIAALVGRSPDTRSGILHGLVVWGSTAGALGFAIVLLFSGLLSAFVRVSSSGVMPAPATHFIGQVAQVAGLTVWLFWAGIVGGLFTSLLGGWLGARSESKAPLRLGARAPAVPRVPQPA